MLRLLVLAALVLAVMPASASAARISLAGDTHITVRSGVEPDRLPIAPAGDVNGDRRPDLIVGASGIGDGNAWVVFGQAAATTIDLDALGSHGFVISETSGLGGTDFGHDVAGVGDVNGDGRDDVAVSFPVAGAGGARRGGAAVVFGSASTAAVAVDSQAGAVAGGRGYVLRGHAVNSYSEWERVGQSVAGAGDVNDDGRPDVIIGAPMMSRGNPDCYGSNQTCHQGGAYVVFGKSSTGMVDIDNLGNLGFEIWGPEGEQDLMLGESVAGGSDVDGDGRADVVVASSGGDHDGRIDAGVAYVVRGRDGTAIADLGTLPNGVTWAGFRVDGALAGDGLGWSSALVPDSNGDGRAELLLGAPNKGAGRGGAYVVFGRSATTPVDAADLGTAGYQLAGSHSGARSGSSVAAAPDLNGDGRPELLIGSPNANQPQWLGTIDAVGSMSVVFGEATATSLSLADAQLGEHGYTVYGPAPNAHYGEDVGAVEDLDGDGWPDLAISSSVSAEGGPDTGAVRIITATPRPAVTTGGATAEATSATLAGSVRSPDGPATWSFEYGTASATVPVVAAAASAARPVSAVAGGLTPATVHGYRIVAHNAWGVARGASAQFTTAPVATAEDGGATADTVAPVVTVTPPACRAGLSKRRCRARRTRAGAWRTLRGVATDAAPTSGLARVEVALVRRSGARCAAWTGTRFGARACARARTAFRPAALSGSAWSVKVASLGAGTYELRVRAVDGAGHSSAVVVRALRLR